MSSLIVNYLKYKNLFSLTLFISLLYFSYHLFNGDHGLISLVEIKDKIAQSKIDLNNVTSEKLIISHKTNLLKEQSLDIDILDEQVRRILGYAGENEKIIILK